MALGDGEVKADVNGLGTGANGATLETGEAVTGANGLVFEAIGSAVRGKGSEGEQSLSFKGFAIAS
ncbi:hypothetical protein [Altericista sp. CCNU0014]|uniref:hypothetical protein n=1 Tax=Altericista sp. CCNU0014 TaxID=3082949 RepID=UPI00384C3A10